MINVNMTDKAGVTLATAGKYCADNVKVTPSAEILRKDEQAKSATPTETAQDITPDSGKVLSKVSVGAIPKTYVGSGVTKKAAATVSPSTSEQTVCASGVYTTGAQKVAAITKNLLAQLDPDFVAANIKKDVDLFGLVGTLEAGGAAGITTGVYIPASTGYDHVITHGLGVIPKLFAICAGSYVHSGSNVLDSAHGFSDRKLLFRMSRVSAANSPSGYIENAYNITNNGFPKRAALANANETTINVGGNYQLTAGIEYYWFALA